MKILIIGLDAATMDVIKPWTDAEHLSHLSHLMKEGAHSDRLKSVQLNP